MYAEVTVVIHVERPSQELGVGVVSDGDEHAVGREVPHLTGRHVAEAHGGDGAVAEDLVDDRVPRHDDLGVTEHLDAGPAIGSPSALHPEQAIAVLAPAFTSSWRSRWP